MRKIQPLNELMSLKDIQVELQKEMKKQIPNFKQFFISSQMKSGYIGTRQKLKGDAYQKGNTGVHIQTKLVEGLLKWKDVKKYSAEKDLKSFKATLFNGTTWSFYPEKKDIGTGNFYDNPYVDQYNQRTR